MSDGTFSDNELFGEFLEEIKDIFGNIDALFAEGQQLGKLESAQVDELFRYIHTLKGGFGMFNMTKATGIAHKLETFLDKKRKDKADLLAKEIRAFEKFLALIKAEAQLRPADEPLDVSVDEPVEEPMNTGELWGVFAEFYSSMDYFVEDQRKVGKHFLVASAENAASPLLQQLDALALERLQEDGSKGPYEVLYSTTISEGDDQWSALVSSLEKFAGEFRWVTYAPAMQAQSQRQSQTQSQAISVAQAPAPKHQEILRVPLDQVNEALEGTWEVFLMANKINYLLQTNEQVFAQSPQLYQDFEQIGQSLERNIRYLETRIMHMRMAQLSNVFARMEKVVQKFCQDQGRKINVSIHGGMTKLDKKIVDMLAEPLIHLVRNCIDHGIEESEVRLQKGKPEAGELLIRAEQVGNNVVIIVQDDGKGIDQQKLLAKAKSMNMDVDALQSEESIVNLIFAPGLSTAEKLSDISGRGVGMDAVRSSVIQLGGKVEVHTKKDSGTSFHITLPLGVSVLSCLLVEINGSAYALDAGLITETKSISLFEIKTNSGKNFIRYQDNYIPCFQMSEYFQSTEQRRYAPKIHERISCILTHKGVNYSLLVDKIIDSISLVAKPLPKFSAAVPFIMSASILPTGAPVFILDGVGIVDHFQKKEEVKHAS